MPIYEYKCGICNQIFEKLVFRPDEEEVRCPKCGDSKVDRVMSVTGILGSTCAAPSSGIS